MVKGGEGFQSDAVRGLHVLYGGLGHPESPTYSIETRSVPDLKLE